MAERPPDVPPQHDNPEVAHEYTDVNVSGIVKFAVGLIAFAVVAHLILAWLFGVLARKTDRDQPPLPPVARQERERERQRVKAQLQKAAKNPGSEAVPQPARVYEQLQTIPTPRLQVSDQADLGALLKKDEGVLNALGWVDEKAGIARIPIDDAIRLVADPQKAAALGIRVRQQKIADLKAGSKSGGQGKDAGKGAH